MSGGGPLWGYSVFLANASPCQIWGDLHPKFKFGAHPFVSSKVPHRKQSERHPLEKYGLVWSGRLPQTTLPQTTISLSGCDVTPQKTKWGHPNLKI